MKNPYYPFSVEVSGFTSLKSLEGVYYKANIGEYKKFKTLMLIISILIAIVCIAFIVCSSGWLQCLSSAILGGTFSAIIWIISVIVSDKINSGVQQIDKVIFDIDTYIRRLSEHHYYCYNGGLHITEGNPDNLSYRILNMLQVSCDLANDENIDSSELKLKWLDETDILQKQFNEQTEALFAEKHIAKYTVLQLSDFVIYNEHELVGHLRGLKNVLLKRKNYITNGNAPIPQNKVEERISKANRFDKIFNHKEYKKSHKGE